MSKVSKRTSAAIVIVLLTFVAIIFFVDKTFVAQPAGTRAHATSVGAVRRVDAFASMDELPLTPLTVLWLILPYGLIVVILIAKFQSDARRLRAQVTVLRGIRGATTVTEDTAAAILEATEELVREIVAANALVPQNIGSALFTVTPDLHAEFPAAAARRMGWTMVPLLNFTEIGVPGRLERCIRVLVHVNTTRTQNEMVHVYLREAVALRPDLASPAQTARPTVRSSTPQ